jgi:hypothetical protein
MTRIRQTPNAPIAGSPGHRACCGVGSASGPEVKWSFLGDRSVGLSLTLPRARTGSEIGVVVEGRHEEIRQKLSIARQLFLGSLKTWPG